MKVAYILPSLINKGPIVVVNNIVKYLQKYVERVDVYYFDESESKLDFECNVYKIDKKDHINFDDYDIIHSHTIRPDIYIKKNLGRITKSKIITTIHQDTYGVFKLRFNSIISFFITLYWLYIQSKFHKILAISNQIRDKYHYIFKDKIVTIYNGAEIDENQTIDNNIQNSIEDLKKKGFKVLISYCNITKDKGLQNVLDVLNSLNEYAYVIIGDGPYLKTLRKIAKENIVEDRVLFFPYLKKPYFYLKHADVYMMPSYSEGFGLAVVEASLMKKSIVCSNIGTFKEIFMNNEVNFFDLNNKESLISSIKNAYEKKEAYAEAAFYRANDFFTAETMSYNHYCFYKELLNKN